MNRPVRILLIEDTKAHAHLYKSWIECDSAHSIQVWFELTPPADDAVVAQFDAVICDFWMGGVNGASIAKRYRDLYPKLPIAILTNAEPELVELDVGDRIQLLSKNCNPDDLSTDLRTWLQEWGVLDSEFLFLGERMGR